MLDEASPVREGQGFDRESLEKWLKSNVPDVQGDLVVEQFGRGYSNLTYLLRIGGRELVLRRPPPGVKIKSAHDMGREFKILSALSAVWPKAPKPIARCDDEGVIGTPFYLMQRVRGVILRAKVPPTIDLSPPALRASSEALIDTLAEIHTVDWKSIGLSDLGKPEGYVERQVRGWADRYRKSKTDDVATVDQLEKWLISQMPPDRGASAATLIHNDFKYDNVVLDESLTRVVSVLDWEMATIGDPMMDLGTTLGYWIQPDDPPVFQVMVFGPTNRAGSLTRMELVRRWEEKTRRDASNVLYCYAYALFKLAVVAQQLYKRWKDGVTKEDRYAVMLEGVRAVTSAALVAIEKGRIDRLSE